MFCTRFSLVLCGGVVLAGLAAAQALAQDSAPPRDSGTSWDNGPVPGGPPGMPRGDGPRRPDAQRGDARMPPGPPDRVPGPRDDRPQPPGDNPRHNGRPRGDQGDRRPPQIPGGPEGPGMQPPGPPPGMRMDLETLKARDPELYKVMMEDRDLERQTRDQAEQYRRADKDEQVKIKEKLAEIVNKHFAVRQELRTLEVKRLEQQLKQLRDKIEQREKNRKEIVAKRLTEVLGTDEEEHF